MSEKVVHATKVKILLRKNNIATVLVVKCSQFLMLLLPFWLGLSSGFIFIVQAVGGNTYLYIQLVSKSSQVYILG